jgi:hypothetical protein
VLGVGDIASRFCPKSFEDSTFSKKPRGGMYDLIAWGVVSVNSETPSNVRAYGRPAHLKCLLHSPCLQGWPPSLILVG